MNVSGSEYPAWCHNDEVPVTKSEIYSIFNDLTAKFGFQRSSMENMYHHLLAQLDSRASRTSAQSALVSLHVSYIGGDHANFRKWYFAAQLDLDEEIGFQNMQLRGRAKQRNFKLAKKRGVSIKEQLKEWELREKEFINTHPKITLTERQIRESSDLTSADYKWKLKMKQLTPWLMVRQLALYLLIWGEANQIRFAPECLCFIYKCALDYDSVTLSSPTSTTSPHSSTLCRDKKDEIVTSTHTYTSPEYSFLNEIITPLYKFLRDQLYSFNDETQKWVRKEKDHAQIIGYDDVNQLFWYPEGIERLVLESGERLVDIPVSKRYSELKNVVWHKAFYKTYRESRTWMHCFTNFNRFWIIHLAPFWFFTSFNSPTLYTKNYIQLVNSQPTLQVRLSVMAIGGSITCLLQIIATLCEWSFVPREWPGAQHLTRRMFGLLLVLTVNLGPVIYVLGFHELDVHSKSAYIISVIQLIIAILTTLVFSVRPLGAVLGTYLNKGKGKRTYVSSQTFTASFPKLIGRSKWFSIGLWITVFVAKFTESYFFLTLSLRDPIRVLSTMELSRCSGDALLGKFLCEYQSKITLLLMLLSDLGLFFLDTYLWYIICNCVFSIILSFSLGTSIFTPWKNIYSRLPKRIYSKILATLDMDVKFRSKFLISQIWNAIIISMYREHLLSIEHVQRLLYQQVDSILQDTITLRSPTFFIAQDDSTYKSVEFFPINSEAKRRICFFAQSLSTPITEPVPVECMPSFTVLVPHYSEKILLSLREIIKEESIKSKITVLEYLKNLHPAEWACFVRDTKLLNLEKESLKPTETNKSSHSYLENTEDLIRERINDLPFNLFGFNSSGDSFTLRTRIWASLRTQTLFRTVSGFMNYAKAIKLLYRVENTSISQLYDGDVEGLESNLNNMASRKFRMLVAMQRYTSLSPEELKDVELLLRTYPQVHISYLLTEQDEDGNLVYYSCLTNGFCDVEKNLRKPIFKIRLSGNPILGDGKSDNQNHSIIFYRGEYIQVIDANQDNYIEECLKIRSILSEFEELDLDTSIPYIPGIEYEEPPAPIAILGAREHIFSVNIGVLGDIAAGKEQTFGTLFARTLAEIGGKLHYGHPDFINAIFMTTRGGLSKAQRGLHLNEDIYAGITAICRGGRIKHSDYFQCGKGRDLGFSSILNFTTKIGAGMGEQLLSREYYYLGTQLPIDRFLSFFYAHAGFHLNNFFICMSLHLFFLLLLNLGSLNYEIIPCIVERHSILTDLMVPIGCYNIQPALHWVTIFVFSIFIVFFIAFAPLIIQEILEKGIWKATIRFFHHLLSMAPLFEVFVCQVYSHSLLTDLTFGGAKYIPTGRGFAITRIDFALLYSRFAIVSIYGGLQIFLMLLFATVTMWQPALLWFWITVISLCFAPFIFNPHQFSFAEFFLDYRNFIHWLSSGNSSYVKESWASFVKSDRARYTGYKRKLISDVSEQDSGDVKKGGFRNLFFSELLCSLLVFIFNFTGYTFINAQTGVSEPKVLTSSVVRLVLVTMLPIASNTVFLLLLFFTSLLSGALLSFSKRNTGASIAFLAHGLSVIIYLVTFEAMWYLEGWNFPRTLILLITSINLHVLIFKLLTILCLTREFKNNKSHLAWWTGRWYNTGMGWGAVLQPIRELVVKVMESSYFAGDFFLGHFLLYLQTPFVFIPFIDYWHSMTLFWLNPTTIVAGKRLFTRKQRKLRNRVIGKYFILYISILLLLLALLIAPSFAHMVLPNPEELLGKTPLGLLVQPNHQNNNDTGPNAPSTIMTIRPPVVPFKTVA